MICPNCKQQISDDSHLCPACGQTILHATEIGGGELEESRYKDHTGNGAFFQRFIYIRPSSTASPFSAPISASFITLALALLMGMTHGFLAFLGFLFFYGVLWFVSIFLQANAILKGHVIPDLVIKCCLWALSWLIVSHLA